MHRENIGETLGGETLGELRMRIAYDLSRFDIGPGVTCHYTGEMDR